MYEVYKVYNRDLESFTCTLESDTPVSEACIYHCLLLGVSAGPSSGNTETKQIDKV